jgi:WD40 repeat protein/energy-coupling factor transporter ATP-binding protein EcfA2
MASLFISHSSRDRGVAQQVSQWLRHAGYFALFLDFDPSDGIAVGRRWEAELYAQLRRADGVVFLASDDSVASKWCFAELSLARSLGRPVFPLRLDATAHLELLQDVQWADLAAGETGLGQLRDGLQQAGLLSSDSFAWDPARSPFPGLEPFGLQDAAVFFGREREIDDLSGLLTSTLLRGPGRFVAIVGPSGSGKSSLLRAGLLPRLDRLAERWVIVPAMLPGRQPLRNLARSLEQAFRNAGRERPGADLLDRLEEEPASLVEFCYELGEAAGGGTRSVLVVVDQAEELVTRSSPLAQKQFLALLRGALDEESPMWTIATLRAEFLSSAPDRAGLAEAIDDTLLVEPLSRARLPEIIQRPAQRAGLDFAPGLVQRMVEDTTGGDALPMLAWTLKQLYDGAGPGPERVVTVEAYETLGGVIGSLQRQADRLTEELQRRGQGDLVLPTLLKLVTIDDMGEPTRRRVERNRLTESESAIVQAFIDARLVTSNRTGEEITVEVAHEALLRQWPPLRETITRAQEGLRMRSQVERLAGDWEHNGDDESYLLRGARLAAFEAWVDQNPDNLGVVDRRFLDASRALADREQTAAADRRQIQAEAWGRAALFELDREPEKAVLLALAALATDRDAQAAAVIRSVSAVLDRVQLRHILREHSDRLAAIAFSPDGQTVLTGSYDGTARLWELQTGKPLQVLTGHAEHVVCVAWSPDGARVATGSWDGTARIWDPSTGDCVTVLTGHDSWVSSVNWSPDGRYLATASRDNTSGIWNPADGRLTQRLAGHTDWVRSAEWRPDGRHLLTGSYDHTAAIWDVRSGRRLGELSGHVDAVPAVRWLPDGRHAITASEDGTLRIWEVDRAREIRSISVHSSPTYCLDIDQAGSRVVAGSEDGGVRIFDITSGAPERTLPGHGSWVSSVRWSPDGDWIASCSGDATARLTFLPGRQQSRAVERCDHWVSSIRWNPDGVRAVRASGDLTLRIWPVDGDETGTETATSMAGMNVLCASWHCRGALLATGGFNGEVRVIDTSRLELADDFPQHQDRVTGIAWQPGGSLFATASNDRTAMVIDSDTGTAVVRFYGEMFESVSWNSRGDTLAIAGWDNDIHLWRTGQPADAVQKLSGHTAALHDIAWAPDGDRLVSTSGDGSARVWSVSDNAQIAQMRGGEAFAVGWSMSGRFIATGSRDGTVRIWDAATAELVQELRHAEAIHSLDWSPDSERILTGGEHGGVALWDVGLDHLRQELMELARHVLTDDEIRRLVPEWPDLWPVTPPHTRQVPA